MMKHTNNRKRSRLFIIFLAYFLRFGWVTISAVLIAFSKSKLQLCLVLCILCYILAAHQFLGWKHKWKHYYCFCQNCRHIKMTPDRINWSEVKKSEAYGLPLIFFVFGTIMLIFIIIKL